MRVSRPKDEPRPSGVDLADICWAFCMAASICEFVGGGGGPGLGDWDIDAAAAAVVVAWGWGTGVWRAESERSCHHDGYRASVI